MKKGDIFGISDTAKYLGVSTKTLYRWEESGKLLPSYKSEGGTRYYSKTKLNLFLHDPAELAREWIQDDVGENITPEQHCKTSSIFQARLTRMYSDLVNSGNVSENTVALIVAVVGEVGQNAFDHNIGNWPDVAGLFFTYDVERREVVLVDRGQGVLKTLKRTLNELETDIEALRVAFTDVVSGRSPENRGNGLKFVRKQVKEKFESLIFQSGETEVKIENGVEDLIFNQKETSYRGCFVKIKF